MMDKSHNTPPTADQRLFALPPKAAQPFRQLLTTGQITDETVNLVLDAGELAQDTSKLIGFAAGYLSMRAQNVPVHDVIAMAKSQNRRLNLAWSPQRWKDEHERLSRAEALRRMADENVRYDVSAYQQHLPPKFPGYLIKSSRRLGMEGLRQRHCVANYHARLVAGTCAIAAVFVDKQRWTVELALGNDPLAPLRITQIKTRYNGLPSPDVRQRIHKLLAIEIPKAPAQPPQATERPSLYLENLRRVLPVLREQAIETVIVNFDGSGDSGQIGDIDYYPADRNAAVRNLPIEHLQNERFFDDGQWTSRVMPQQASLDDAITALTDDYQELSGCNWWDNDGGYGTLEIDVQAGTVELNIYIRNVDSFCDHSSCRNIETGEEI